MLPSHVVVDTWGYGLSVLDSEISMKESQLTIDLVSEAHTNFYVSRNFQIDDLKSFSYTLENVLKVINPELKLDLRVLRKLYLCIENMINYMDSDIVPDK